MTNLDERLTTRLHALVDGEPDSAAPTATLLARGRRARRRRAGTFAGGALAMLALGALGTATLVQRPAPDRPAVAAEASAPAPASPQMELAAAVATTESTSYRVTVRRTNQVDPNWVEITTGAFDPATANGWLRTPYTGGGVGFMEERLVDGVYFVGDAGVDKKLHWEQYRGKRKFLPFDVAMGGALSASAEQEGLLQVLKKTGATVTRTGDRAYHFSVEPTGKDTGYGPGAPLESETVVGDVTLDAQNRIAKLNYELTLVWNKNGKIGPPAIVRVAMTFADYGAPVAVERPAHAKIVK
ncbi:hypothetical protein GCM10010169_08220 [Micromonospora fulviviridis]|uniref:hypothetical protein n=1 Tax=Micromonospora fulviviridis TaxID=47860 RepID=UPI00166E98C4|nr:hypothetical protein [Micromonospora fulviviridis]GGR66945.1 hypothetical protein GCM10010169_08220 [Micromonospora fulviviridis]